MLKNYIGISRDHSGSMSSIGRAAARDYNANIESIRTAAKNSGIETLVSVVECGYGRTDSVRREIVNESVANIRPINERDYSTSGYGTPLFDSVGELIEIFEEIERKLPTKKNTGSSVDALAKMNKEQLRQACRDAKISYSKLNNDGMRAALKAAGVGGTATSQGDDVSFLIMAVTDGAENASRRYSAFKIAEKIKQLQATDRWTFVFRVPRGYSRHLINLGIPAGNILEWDQTEKGVEVATVATTQAFETYYSGRTRGVTSTRGFYSTDLAGVSKQTIKAKLVDISSQVQFFNVTREEQIRPFVESRIGGSMLKGGAFYQLTKKEDEVQDYKMIAIRDKKTGSVYSGVEARNILGLPHFGTVKVAPGNHGNYDIFIQSTSVNRKLVPGTQLMYWSRVGQAYLS